MQVVNPNPKVLEKEFLFIIGSPRSGTTWLQLMLGAHPQVCATTELRLYNKYIAPWLEAWQGEALLSEEGKHYLGLPVLWTEGEFRDFLRSFLERVYAKVLATKPQATHVLDKHPHYSAFVEDIHFFIPGVGQVAQAQGDLAHPFKTDFRSPLLLVLGHEHCGAVAAAVADAKEPGHIANIVKAIRPAVIKTKGRPGDPMENAIRANVQDIAVRLRSTSPILAEKVKAGQLKVMGATLALGTGKVELVPDESK
jgi:hypothetical protein